MEVAQRHRYEPTECGPLPDGRFLVRTFADGKWSDKRVLCHLAQIEYDPSKPLPLSEEMKNRVLPPPQHKSGDWEVDVFYAPSVINEGKGERPYFPRVMSFMDCDTGMIVGMEMARNDEAAEAYQKKFLDLLASLPMWPSTIRYRKDYVRAVLSPLAEHHGIKMKKYTELPATEEMRREMRQFFKKDSKNRER